MAAELRDAATVLLLRDAGNTLEVFMVERNSSLTFLGGAHVFPGGAVDAGDSSDEMRGLLSGFDEAAAAELLGEDDPARTVGYFVAAVRELFEEAGILLARDREGRWVGLATDEAAATRLSSYRAMLGRGQIGFAKMLADEGLTPALDGLHYYAHWITPEGGKKRFDTRFFLAELPPGQAAVHDRGESVAGQWMSPALALERYARREISMVPPTICTLDRLALHGSVGEAIEASRLLEVVEIFPKVSAGGDALTILYPGDEDYDRGVPGTVSPGKVLNRLTLRDGLWVKPGQ
ncbi:MAG: NUDIX hydrolase [Candidatus Binatia bacterium]